MTRHPQKSDFPVSQVRRYLEPGPIVLVSSQWQGKTNVMTLGWHTVLEFSPSLVGCMISGGNHSFHMIRNSRECVIKSTHDHAYGHSGRHRKYQRSEDR